MQRLAGPCRRAAIRLLAIGLLGGLTVVQMSVTRSSAQVPTPPTWAGAEAVTAAIGTPPRPIDGSPYAAVPAAGGNITDAAALTTIGGVGTVELPGVSANGGPIGGSGGTATTTVTAWRIDLFGGRVRANDMRASATATLADGQARVDGDVTFEELVVDGVPYPAPALNQRIPLPGIGTLIVRERTFATFGPAAATVFVRAFHVVPAGAGLPGAPGSGVAAVPGGGEIVVGAVTAGVPDVALLPPGVLTTSALATPQSYVAISTRAPIDTSIRTSLVGNDNFNFDNDNSSSNGNGNDNRASSTATPTARATTGSQQIVVTVVVVVQPASTPTATSTRTP